MENIIYEWLINSVEGIPYYKFSLIDCITILSINGLYISIENLKCFFSKNFKKNDYENNLGLNEFQFQLIKNNLKSLNKNNNNNNNNIETFINKINFDNNNNNNDNNDILKIKFNCSIFIIIENNKKYIINNKKYIINKNSNNNNNKELINYKNYNLFKKVWNNLVIRNEIIFHSRLYNLHKFEINFKGIEEYKNYKFKSYLTSINLMDNRNDKLQIKQGTFLNGLKSIKFRTGFSIELDCNCLPESLTQLEFNNVIFSSPFTEFTLHENITSLTFTGRDFKQTLESTWLPKSIKSLDLEYCTSFQQAILIKHKLPISLITLKLNKNYFGKIEPKSIPKSVTTLKFNINSNNNLLNIPRSTTTLIFDNEFNNILNDGDIPDNVSTIRFGNNFNQIINENSLPISLTKLSFGVNFNQAIQENSLPSNLLKLKFEQDFNQPLLNNLIFKNQLNNLKSLKFGWYYNQLINIPNSGGSGSGGGSSSEFNEIYKKLKTLKFGSGFNQIINKSSLPSTLKKLDLGGYNHPLTLDSFPNSLEYLTICYNFNNPNAIGPSILPSNLKSLTIINYSNRIIDLSPINCLPSSLNYIHIYGFLPIFDINTIPKNLNVIYCDRYARYIKNLDTHFISKYIKYRDD
ncbi:hypothetical protein ACTFIW_008687 [Dictyostelium discoideum]